MPTSSPTFSSSSSSTSILYLPPGGLEKEKGNHIRTSREKLASVYKQKIKTIKSESRGDPWEAEVKCYTTYVKDLNDQIDVLLSLLASTEQQLNEMSQSKNKPWYGTKNVRTQCHLLINSQSQLRDIGTQCAVIENAERPNKCQPNRSCKLERQESQYCDPNCVFPQLRDIGTQCAVTKNDNQQAEIPHEICQPKCFCTFENQSSSFNKIENIPKCGIPSLREIGTQCMDIKTANKQAERQQIGQQKQSCKCENQAFQVNQINKIPNVFVPRLREIGTQCAFIENTNKQVERQNIWPPKSSCQFKNQAFQPNQREKTPNCCIAQSQETGCHRPIHTHLMKTTDSQSICPPRQSKSPIKKRSTDLSLLFSSRDPSENQFSAMLMSLMNEYDLQNCLPAASSTCQPTWQPICPHIDNMDQPESTFEYQPSCKQGCQASCQPSFANEPMPETKPPDCTPAVQSAQLQDWKGIIQASYSCQPECQHLYPSQPVGSKDSISTAFGSHHPLCHS